MNQPTLLKRRLGIPGAVLLGLGSIIGTGLFVGIGLGASVAGTLVLPAIVIAALVAWCNAMSGVQLADACPVADETDAYGSRYLSPRLGFTAGWMFLAAQSTAAAAAALGLAGYLLSIFNLENSAFRTPLAVAIVALITLGVLGGIRRSTLVNALLVSIPLVTPVFFLIAGLPVARLHLPNEANPLPMRLRLPRDARSGLTPLRGLAVKGRAGIAKIREPGGVRDAPTPIVRLGEIGRFVRKPVEKAIYHKDLQPVVFVYAEAVGRAPAEIVADVVADLGPVSAPEGTPPRPLKPRSYFANGGGLAWSMPEGTGVRSEEHTSELQSH